MRQQINKHTHTRTHEGLKVQLEARTRKWLRAYMCVRMCGLGGEGDGKVIYPSRDLQPRQARQRLSPWVTSSSSTNVHSHSSVYSPLHYSSDSFLIIPPCITLLLIFPLPPPPPPPSPPPPLPAPPLTRRKMTKN